MLNEIQGEMIMPKGSTTPPEIVEKIKLCRAIGMSYMGTARACGIGDTTVHAVMGRIMKNPKTKEEFEKLCEDKQKELREQANKDFDALMKYEFEMLFKKSVSVINKAIDENKLSPRDAVTVMGTTFDKRQVLTGGKTANIGLSYDEVMKAINKGNEY